MSNDSTQVDKQLEDGKGNENASGDDPNEFLVIDDPDFDPDTDEWNPGTLGWGRPHDWRRLIDAEDGNYLTYEFISEDGFSFCINKKSLEDGSIIFDPFMMMLRNDITGALLTGSYVKLKTCAEMKGGESQLEVSKELNAEATAGALSGVTESEFEK